MIELSEIKKYYPTNIQGFDSFILREYLQYKILEIIFESEFGKKLAFLGGTNLRIVHNNQRFSEDLDFDNFDMTESTFSLLSDLIAEKLTKQGYKIEMREVHKTAFLCYIKFPELLFDLGLSAYKTEKILIQLDTEAQHYNYKPELFILNKFDIFQTINVCSPSLLLAQKFYAVLNRKRNKGRDFLDIVFLMSMNISPDFGFLNQKTKIQNVFDLKMATINHCKSLDMKEMADDVAPFLFNPKDRNKVLLFEEYILQNLK